MGISWQKTFNNYLTQMDSDIKALVQSLKEAMNTKATNPKKDDW